ncbi:MAG: glycosyltransferase family 4 protein [Planctomycetota bacterium]
MKIGMVLDGLYPPDDRVEKEMATLRAAGHVVTLFCLAREGQPAEEERDGILIRRWIPRLARPEGWEKLLTGVDTAWRRMLLNEGAREGISALHVHDLPLALTGAVVARTLGIYSVLDLHENWPAAVRVWEKGASWKGLYPWLYNRFWRWSWIEKQAVLRADAVIVVAEENRDRFLRMKIPGERFRVVTNAADLALYPEVAPPPAGFRVLYVGGMTRHRGLDVLVRAFVRVRENAPEAELVLVGEGEERPALEALVADLGMGAAVLFPGWLSKRECVVETAGSHVGVIPHRRSPHTDTTLPNKLFDYMAAGRPVVATDAAPLRRIVGETGCGGVVPSGDPGAMARGILEFRDRARARDAGAAGRRAVETTYNWAAAGRVLAEVYAP